MAEERQEVTFELKLNTDQTIKDARNLNKELNAIFKITGDEQLSAKMQKATNRLEKQQYALQEMEKKMHALQTEKVPTKEYTDLQKTMDALANKADKLNTKIQQITGSTEKEVQERAKVLLELEKTESQINSTRASIKALVNDEKAFTFADNSEEVDKLSQKMNILSKDIKANITALYEGDNALAEMVYSSDDLTDALGNTAASSKWIAEGFHETAMAEEEVSDNMFTATQELAEFIANGVKLNLVTRITHGIADGFKDVLKIIRKILSATKNLISAGFKKLASVAKDVASRMKLINKESNAHELSLKKLVNMTLKYGLGIRSIFILWRKLRAYATDALKLMAQQFTEIDEVVSGIINSFNQFKNSVGTAVQPLMTAFAPALELILGLLTKMNESLANFFAILTGQKYIYKAKKSNDSYAESLKKVGKTAKEANKDIASYDKLLVINKNKGNGTGSGSGDVDETVDAFEKTIADSKFAEQLKSAIADDDWEGVGSLFAEKLNTIVTQLGTWLTNDFSPAASKWATRLASILNGFIGETNWSSLGTTVATGLNGIITAVNKFVTQFNALNLGEGLGNAFQGFLDTTNWSGAATAITGHFNNLFSTLQGFSNTFDGESLGTDISTFINTAVTNFDWEENAKALSDFAKDFLDAISTALTTTNWVAVGDSIVTGLKSIDWSGIISKAFKTAGGVAGGLAAIIGGAIASAVEDVYKYFKKQVEDCGGNVIKGIFVGIKNALKGLWNWIKENVFLPFWNGFKHAFGIASPSKKMKEIGKYIIEGLISGIVGMIKALGEAIGKVKDAIVGVFKGIMRTVGNIWYGVKKTLIDGASKLLTPLKKAFEPVAKAVKGVFEGIKTAVGKIWDKLAPGLGVLAKIWTKAVAGFTLVKNAVVGVFQTLYDTVAGIWDDLVDKIKESLGALNTILTEWGWDDWKDLFMYLGGDIADFLGIKSTAKNSSGGGGSFGVDRLASGAVIPPNREFLAILGDQKSGTNVEAPLATIQEALANVLAKWDNNRGNQDITLNLDGKTVARVVWDETQKKYKQTGVRYA